MPLHHPRDEHGNRRLHRTDQGHRYDFPRCARGDRRRTGRQHRLEVLHREEREGRYCDQPVHRLRDPRRAESAQSGHLRSPGSGQIHRARNLGQTRKHLAKQQLDQQLRGARAPWSGLGPADRRQEEVRFSAARSVQGKGGEDGRPVVSARRRMQVRARHLQ